MLQIAVHDGAAVALGIGEPGEYGGLLAEIAGKAHAAHAPVRLGGGLYFPPGAVAGAVVHEQQLKGDILPSENVGESRGGHAYHGFLIVRRQDHGQLSGDLVFHLYHLG